MRTARHIALAATVATTACTPGGAPPCEAEFGPWGEMPGLDMLVGDTVETSLEDHFRPVYCFKFYADDDEVWLVQSTDPSAVAVWRKGVVLTTAALDVADSVRVVVESHPFGDVGHPEGFGGFGHEFLVRVRPRA